MLIQCLSVLLDTNSAIKVTQIMMKTDAQCLLSLSGRRLLMIFDSLHNSMSSSLRATGYYKKRSIGGTLQKFPNNGCRRIFLPIAMNVGIVVRRLTCSEKRIVVDLYLRRPTLCGRIGLTQSHSGPVKDTNKVCIDKQRCLPNPEKCLLVVSLKF